MKRAKQMLDREPDTVAEAAYAMGCSPFSRAFREQADCTPSAYVDRQAARIAPLVQKRLFQVLVRRSDSRWKGYSPGLSYLEQDMSSSTKDSARHWKRLILYCMALPSADHSRISVWRRPLTVILLQFHDNTICNSCFRLFLPSQTCAVVCLCGNAWEQLSWWVSWGWR